MKIAATAFILFSASLLAFVAQRPSNSVLPGRVGLEGIVLRGSSGEPISGAQVTALPLFLPPQDQPAPRTVGTDAAEPPGVQAPETNGRLQQVPPITTGSDGRFSFQGLNPGAYRVLVTASGFVRQEYGQRAGVPDGPGNPIYLDPGQTVKDLEIQLTQTAIVGGRIFDELGQPAIGAPVQLVQDSYGRQGKTLRLV